jgi:hypothetical protein
MPAAAGDLQGSREEHATAKTRERIKTAELRMPKRFLHLPWAVCEGRMVSNRLPGDKACEQLPPGGRANVAQHTTKTGHVTHRSQYDD